MRNKLLAYALHFASFLLENGVEPKRIILFGSVVSGTFDRESDVDIFIEIDAAEEKHIRTMVKLFDKTFGEKWKLKGIDNPISVHVGDLRAWPRLRRGVQSYGILLYGPYSEFPEHMTSFLLFQLNFSRLSRTQKVRVWRKMYGYVQKAGKKRYETKGMVEAAGGKKLAKSLVLVPMNASQEFRQFLNTNGIDFSVHEVWSDAVTS